MKVHDNFINLYLKGTGRNNHDNSIIKLNDIEILKNGLFQGLALVILNRVDMSVSEINYYDTINHPLEEKINVSYINYTYDESTDKVLSEENQIEVINKNNFPAYKLNEKLKSLTEKNLIAIVSCYGWEKYITNDLIDTFTKFGALNILEFKTFINYEHSKSNRTFEYEIINKTNLFHPFAFLGIPNIGATNGFESIRTNKGHFLTTKNLPFAELLVRIKYDEKALNFYFDREQYSDKSLFSDDYEYLFNSPDYSLKNLIDLLIYSNTPTQKNNIFSIYDINKFTEKYLPKNATSNPVRYETTFDIVTLGKNIGAQRKTTQGEIYQLGLNLKNSSYYDYFVQVALNKTDCPAPYNFDKTECLKENHLKQDISILKCKIGLTPQVCLENIKKEYLFEGYKD